MSIADMRKEYTQRGLDTRDVAADPIAQFQIWFEQATGANLPEPNAMTLATATPDGKPSARVVLLKGVDENGFVFYSNYSSRKGNELAGNPRAALVFFWPELERQVRVEGYVEQISTEESDRYFHSRPAGSQLGALASPQSQVIASRNVLEQRLRELDAQYLNKSIPRPTHWGGYRIVASAVEFWQGRPNRLHDRVRYTYRDGEWVVERLAP